jgi:hypothetical protein
VGDPAQAEPSELAKTERLLLDELSERLDTLKLLRAGDDEQAGAVLEQFGARGKVEAEILEQLGLRVPLQHPERFAEAHRTAMHALEVFDRNSARPPSSLRAGPLRPVASPVVQLVVRIIVSSYARTVARQLRELYTRRWAASEPGTREFAMLRLARLEMERVAPALENKATGVPTFLVGGAAVSGIASVLQGLLLKAANNDVVLVAIAAVFSAVALGAFWCILTAAATARRRTRLALDQPLRALWQTIGGAGRPPHDQSRQFAIYAIVVLLIAWLVVPVAIAVAVLH